jgi:molybdate transport system substrate-binding protein
MLKPSSNLRVLRAARSARVNCSVWFWLMMGQQMLRSSRLVVVLGTAMFFFFVNISTSANVANAAEIKVFTTRSIATVLNKIGPEFERTTGHKLNITTDVAIRLVRRINAGEPFDFLVAAPGQIDELIKDGKIIPETRTNLVRSGIGVAVRAGAPKPDISSVEAFKRALINAKSIAYLKEGQSGIYLAGMMERLEIAEPIKSKLTLPDTDIVSELVAKGEIELGMVVITQILTTPGVELVGPLPAEIQSYITFTAGVSADSRASEAAKELMKFIQGPEAVCVIKSQGMEPVASLHRTAKAVCH